MKVLSIQVISPLDFVLYFIFLKDFGLSIVAHLKQNFQGRTFLILDVSTGLSTKPRLINLCQFPSRDVPNCCTMAPLSVFRPRLQPYPQLQCDCSVIRPRWAQQRRRVVAVCLGSWKKSVFCAVCDQLFSGNMADIVHYVCFVLLVSLQHVLTQDITQPTGRSKCNLGLSRGAAATLFPINPNYI